MGGNDEAYRHATLLPEERRTTGAAWVGGINVGRSRVHADGQAVTLNGAQARF